MNASQITTVVKYKSRTQNVILFLVVWAICAMSTTLPRTLSITSPGTGPCQGPKSGPALIRSPNTESRVLLLSLASAFARGKFLYTFDLSSLPSLAAGPFHTSNVTYSSPRCTPSIITAGHNDIPGNMKATSYRGG